MSRPNGIESVGTTRLDGLRTILNRGSLELSCSLRAASERGLDEEQYVRFLSFQHHLTRGVQRHFFTVAGHACFASRRPMREFLVRFALEEEPHYRVAEADLRAMGRVPLDPPVEVELWWAYFDRMVVERPFVRLGATAVLENLGPGTAEESAHLLRTAAFLGPENSRFLVIHRHEVLPHGTQVLAAIEQADPGEQEIVDLERGALVAVKLYLPMMQWALTSN